MAIVNVTSKNEFEKQSTEFRIQTFQSYKCVLNKEDSWSCISHNELRRLRYLLIKASELKMFGVNPKNISSIIDLWITFITHINRTENAIEYGSCFLTREQLETYGYGRNTITKYVNVLSELGYLNVIKRSHKPTLYYPLLEREKYTDFLGNVTYEECNKYLFKKQQH